MNKSDAARLDSKRAALVLRITEIAPHIGQLVNMMDEVKVDLVLIALSGARVGSVADGDVLVANLVNAARALTRIQDYDDTFSRDLKAALEHFEDD